MGKPLDALDGITSEGTKSRSSSEAAGGGYRCLWAARFYTEEAGSEAEGQAVAKLAGFFGVLLAGSEVVWAAAP